MRIGSLLSPFHVCTQHHRCIVCVCKLHVHAYCCALPLLLPVAGWSKKNFSCSSNQSGEPVVEIASPSPGKTWTIVLLRRTVLLAGNILKCCVFLLFVCRLRPLFGLLLCLFMYLCIYFMLRWDAYLIRAAESVRTRHGRW